MAKPEEFDEERAHVEDDEGENKDKTLFVLLLPSSSAGRWRRSTPGGFKGE